MAMEIRWFLAYVVVSHVLVLPLTESRECKLISTFKRCERNCCGVGYVLKCLPSCVGIRCRHDYHCDGGCCGGNGRCRNCPLTPVSPSLRPTTSEIWECQYDSDCCFECSCSEGKCYKGPTLPPKVLWKTTPKQGTDASSSTHHVALLKTVFVFLGCTTCVVVLLVIFGTLHCRRRRLTHRASETAERRIPSHLPRTVSQLNSASNHDPSWTEIAVSNRNYTNEMMAISRDLPPPYTLNPDTMIPPPSYETAVANNGSTGNT